MVARGAPALLTCVNRAHVWTDRHLEEAQQVAHWDLQLPGVPHDRADRLLDLYASGERRAYGPAVLRDRVSVEADAFARGDFSLRIDPLEPADEGTYSCHLHHHYCGLHERRIFHLTVTAPASPPPRRGSPGNGSSHSSAPAPGAEAAPGSRGTSRGWERPGPAGGSPPGPSPSTEGTRGSARGGPTGCGRLSLPRAPGCSAGGWGRRAPTVSPAPDRRHAAPADPTLARDRSVINVIVPEGRAHFFQQLGYVLATLLLFLLLLITAVLATRQRRLGGERGREAGLGASGAERDPRGAP